MYVLSHGFILISYKAFFNLYTWVCLSCVLTSSDYKCLFVVYAFFLWEASCYESFLVSHDVVIYCMLDLIDPYGRYYRLPFRSQCLILYIILIQLVWEIQTNKWVIQTTGESRSVSEVHKSNLGSRFSKNHQITVKLHTMIVGNKIILDYNTETVINRFINTS